MKNNSDPAADADAASTPNFSAHLTAHLTKVAKSGKQASKPHPLQMDETKLYFETQNSKSSFSVQDDYCENNASDLSFILFHWDLNQ